MDRPQSETISFQKSEEEELTAEDLPPANKRRRLSPAPVIVEVASYVSDATAKYNENVDLTEDVEGNVSGVKQVTASCQAQQSITYKGETLSSEVSETVTCVKEIATPQEATEVAGPSIEETVQPEESASTSQEAPAAQEEEEYQDNPEEDVGPPSPPSFTPETPDDIKEALKGLDPPPKRDVTLQELQDILSLEQDEKQAKLKAWWEKAPSPSYPPLNYIVQAKDVIDHDTRWE